MHVKTHHSVAPIAPSYGTYTASASVKEAYFLGIILGTGFEII